MIITEIEISERWADYFEQLLNGEDPKETFDCIQEQLNNCICEMPKLQEIMSQIK